MRIRKRYVVSLGLAAFFCLILTVLVASAASVLPTIKLNAGDSVPVECANGTLELTNVQGGKATVACKPALAIISFTGVSEGATLNGQVVIEAKVQVGSSPVSQVSFTLTKNGATTLTSVDVTAPYIFRAADGWDTRTVANGSYTLSATAKDGANKTAARSINFKVDNSVVATPTPTSTPGGSLKDKECPDSVHNKYVAPGPDGKMYPTWHPSIDAATGCFFSHEHGSDPHSYVGFGSSGMPAFGYISATAGLNEPHNGFKVYVSNNDLNGRAWMIVLHQGTSGPKRALTQFHALDWHISTTGGQKLADLHLMADFGYAVPNCDDQHPIPGSATGYAFGTQPSRRFIPTVNCAAETPYELWDAVVKIGNGSNTLFEAFPRFDVDNATTIINLANLDEVRYMCEVRTPNEDCTSSKTQWTGNKRGVVHPGQFVGNTTGKADVYTDFFGKVVAAGTPGAIKQYLTTAGWDDQECCGNKVVFRTQPTSNGLYIVDAPLGSFEFGVGKHHWPN